MSAEVAPDPVAPAPRVTLGRWQDVLPDTYDPAAAVVITDPPFGLDVPGGGYSHIGETDRGFGDVIPWAVHVTELLDLLPAARHVIRGPATAVIRRDYPQPRRLAIETATFRRRGSHRIGAVPYLWHAWAVYGRLKIGWRARVPLGDVVTIKQYADDARLPGAGHRGITPYGSALWACETWAEPGWIVLDPFAGTGTIGRAAAALGLEYVGAELEPRWHAEAERSLKVAAPSLGL